MKKTMLVLFCFIILCSILVNGIQEELQFSETFGITAIDLDLNSSNCMWIPTETNVENIPLSNYTDIYKILEKDNDWYCIVRTKFGFNNMNLTNTSSSNSFTPQGLKFDSGSVCSSWNCIYVLAYVFEEVISFNNLDIFNYSVNMETTINTNMRLDFFDTMGKSKFSFNIGGSGNLTGMNNTWLCNNETFRNDGTELSNISFLLGELKTSCSNIPNTQFDNIKIMYLTISPVESGDDISYFDDLSFTYKNGTNELPTFAVNMNNTVFCINASSQETNVTFDIEVSDTENDIIYYSLQAGENNKFINIDYETVVKAKSCTISLNPTIRQFLDSWGLSNILNNLGVCQISSLDRFVEYRTFFDSCPVDFSGESNASIFYTDTFTNSQDVSVSMLVHSPNCDKHRESYLKTIFDLKDFTYSSNLYPFPNINNTYNLTFYQLVDNNQIILRLKFLYNETSNIVIYNVNSTNKYIIGSINISDSRFGIFDYTGINIWYNFDSNTYNLSIGTDVDNIVTRIDNIEGHDLNTGYIVKYIGIATSDGVNFVLQENSLYGGITLSPEFSLTKPTIVTFHNIGKDAINVYVTDNIHLDEGTFNVQSIPVTITDCRVLVPSLGSPDTRKRFKILESNLVGMCTSLDNALSIGSYNPSTYGFCFFMNLIYLLVSVVVSGAFAIIMGLLKPQIRFASFLFAFCLLAIFGTLFLPFSGTFMIVIGIIFAISVVMGLRTFFLTGEMGESG